MNPTTLREEWRKKSVFEFGDLTTDQVMRIETYWLSKLSERDSLEQLIEEKRQKMLQLYDIILGTDSDEVKMQKNYINMGVAYCLGVLNSSPTEENLSLNKNRE